ncbi:MAG: hypothetical protein JXP73_03945, partial [Deltaproteobacteria bacterium]|nr:hypothetical protein [Deltaproteobacteria bacterium]
MKRTFVCALALVGLSCSSTAPTGSTGGAGSGGTTSTATESGGTSGATTTTNSGGSSGGSTGGTTTTATGGDTGSGGTGDKGSGGTTSTDTGGAAGAGGGGTTRTAAGGRTGIGAGGATGGRTGGGAGGVASTGGRTGVAAGGAAGQSAGGATGKGGGTGTPAGIVTGPTPVDVTAAGAGLPQYYISPTGNDDKSGTGPEEAWKTVANIPKDKPSMVFFQKGATFTAAGAPARGRDGPAAFNPPKGSVWTSYGDGDKRPILAATEQTAGKPTGAVLMPGGDAVLAGISVTGKANFGILLMSDNNVVQDCEIDGNIEGTLIQLGFSIRGNDNLVVGNYIHSLHEVILDSGSVNTSGGAEGIVVNGTGHEIAYNTLVDLWTPNETLGGAEGGCLEIIARTPGEVVENLNFHHNYCERSVGLFEACAGNFAGT